MLTLIIRLETMSSIQIKVRKDSLILGGAFPTWDNHTKWPCNTITDTRDRFLRKNIII